MKMRQRSLEVKQTIGECMNEFNPITCDDYVISHGFGEATNEGLILARALFNEGYDYATISYEIVSLGLTIDLA